MIKETHILRPVRTEYGKAIRKKYESGEIKESRHNMTRLKPRFDGIANTLTTVLKDNLVFEATDTVRIKQATAKGYIEMEVGGVFDATYPNSKTRRGRVQEGGTICPTITSGSPQIYRIEEAK